MVLSPTSCGRQHWHSDPTLLPPLCWRRQYRPTGSMGQLHPYSLSCNGNALPGDLGSGGHPMVNSVERDDGDQVAFWAHGQFKRGFGNDSEGALGAHKDPVGVVSGAALARPLAGIDHAPVGKDNRQVDQLISHRVVICHWALWERDQSVKPTETSSQ
ncbi:hypothetical protein BJX99DRAFT_254568 [Aspergillus californicus]